MTSTFSIQQHQFFCQLKMIFLCLQLYKEIEICPKVTKVIRFDKAESCATGYGMLSSDHTPFWTT